MTLPPATASGRACAYPAAAIAAAEAPLTSVTHRYMRAAAHAVARAARQELAIHAAGRPLAGARVTVLVGGGHNGGDGLLAGAMLARRGCRVTALLATGRPLPACLEEARAGGVEIVGAGAAVSQLHRLLARQEIDLVIDALTGIGASGPLRPGAAGLVEALDRLGEPGRRPLRVLAVDLPSGCDPDEGTLPGPVLAADRTVTFTCLKGAQLLPPAAALAGRVDVVDLGLPIPEVPPVARRPDDADLARALRVPGAFDHKYTRGVVGIWAGSHSYPGAGVLACSAAVRAGAGMVRLYAPPRVEDLVLSGRPEVVLADGRCQALVIGPGTDPHDADRAGELSDALRRAVEQDVPAVIDAGALPLAARLIEEGLRPTPTQVLTPHAGEAAALLTALGNGISRAEVEAAPVAAAAALAALSGATVVLKGTPTLVAGPQPGCAALSVDPGPGWLATAGSGDVLAGVMGAVLAADRADRELGGSGPGRGQRARPGTIQAPGHESESSGKPGPGAVATARLAALAIRLHAQAGWIASRRSAGPGAAPAPSGGPIGAGDLCESLPAAWRLLHDCRDRDGADLSPLRGTMGP